MAGYDYDLFVIGGGSGGVRAARVAAGARQARRHRRGIPLRRHLRHPRLRAEEALCLCLAISRAFRRRGRLWLDGAARRVSTGRRWSPTRTARSAAWKRSTSRTSKRPAARRSIRAPMLVDRAYDPHREREPHRHRRPDPDRHRRTAQPACGAARPRALHLLQRGVRPAGTAEGDRDRRRRLYRRRVRQHLPRARRRDDADLSRQGDPRALRHGPAAQAARDDGEEGHQDPLPRHLRTDRQARRTAGSTRSCPAARC